MGAAEQPWTADRRLLRLLECWRVCRPGPDLLPSRSAIDPVALGPELLPLTAVVEPTEAGTRFRFRLVGAQLAENAGLDLTRRLICPLAADGRRVDLFVAAQICEVDVEHGDAPTYTFASEFRPGLTLPVPG